MAFVDRWAAVDFLACTGHVPFEPYWSAPLKVVLTQPKVRMLDGDDIGRIARSIKRRAFKGDQDDVILLPELVGEGYSPADYHTAVAELAREFGCHVVGGSQFDNLSALPVNQGIVVDPGGAVIARYQKANPYGRERNISQAGERAGASFNIGGVQCFVLVCADFFHVETYRHLETPPEIIFVPALSVSRKSTPHMARARWRHAMIARAFEQAAYIAVSDWAYPVRGGGGEHPSSGVAGLAHPAPQTTADLLSLLGRSQVRVFDIDLEAGRLLRADQRSRGFEIAGLRQEQP
ncbi:MULTISPECIES: carbon-nitrogen hydrolase family protein [unclassified Devosia]|uniref:carbon-nitrogen hydrolase family protein n=1 Tax=unclassified Devosia TaxID=196773 RepID=UPI001555B2CC|nr:MULTISPECIES: carbon-nitrogen hydrolase family protein [unclassified Devosia]